MCLRFSEVIPVPGDRTAGEAGCKPREGRMQSNDVAVVDRTGGVGHEVAEPQHTAAEILAVPDVFLQFMSSVVDGSSQPFVEMARGSGPITEPVGDPTTSCSTSGLYIATHPAGSADFSALRCCFDQVGPSARGSLAPSTTHISSCGSQSWRPTTLAIMHGPSVTGDCPGTLRALAENYEAKPILPCVSGRALLPTESACNRSTDQGATRD